jgi:hypothetical protein
VTGLASEGLVDAFPSFLRKDALAATGELGENRLSARWNVFPLRLGANTVSIPKRIYFDPPNFQNCPLNPLQSELLDCLLTRHHDGYVRQKLLCRIIGSKNVWVPCFVVPLIGEYVIEILQVILESASCLKEAHFGEFVVENSGFIALTEQRVISYWNCYYRHIKKEAYPGFAILEALKKSSKLTTDN